MQRISEVTREGLTFDVLDDGPEDGDVVVLLHGFPERSSTWAAVAPLLHAAGLRTLAMDQRGYSPRARPPRRRDYAIRELIGDVVALIEAAGGRPVHLVGHDWGAAVGWGLTEMRPDLLLSFTSLSIPHPGAFVTAVRKSGQLRRSWYMGFFQLPRLPERFAKRPDGRFERRLRRHGMTEEEVARFRTEIVADGALPHALHWYRAMPFAPRTLYRRPVTVPTTLVWSDQDGVIDRFGVEETHGYIDAPYELVVLEGVSHWIPTQAPQQAADAALRRIRSVPA